MLKTRHMTLNIYILFQFQFSQVVVEYFVIVIHSNNKYLKNNPSGFFGVQGEYQ